MRLTITITSGAGGSVSTEIDHTDQVLYDLGLDDQDIKNLCGGGAVVIPVKPNPNQLDLGKHIFDLACSMNRVAAEGYCREGGTL